jgi:hypothetical protein
MTVLGFEGNGKSQTDLKFALNNRELNTQVAHKQNEPGKSEKSKWGSSVLNGSKWLLKAIVGEGPT